MFIYMHNSLILQLFECYCMLTKMNKKMNSLICIKLFQNNK